MHSTEKTDTKPEQTQGSEEGWLLQEISELLTVWKKTNYTALLQMEITANVKDPEVGKIGAVENAIIRILSEGRTYVEKW